MSNKKSHEETKAEECKESSENKELENLKKELSETKELLLRTAAEYENFRKRSEKEKSMIYYCATSEAVVALLPMADSLDAAWSAAQSADESYKKGIELLKNQMNTVLKSLEVESFGEIGDEFDPNIHNAISHKEDEEEENQNFISAVFQKGYQIKDKVIRHAMVEVTN